MTASVAELIVRLQDEASKQADAVARALGGIAKQEQHVGVQSAEVQKLGQHLATLQAQAERVTGVRDLQRRLADLQGQAEKARTRVRDLSNALMAAPEATAKMAAAYEKATAKLRDAESAVNSQKFAIGQANSEMNKFGASVDRLASAEARAKAAVAETTAAIKAQTLAEERAAAAQAKLAARRMLTKETAGVFGMVGGMYVGEKATELVRGTAHTYREFDSERRFGGAVMGATYDRQLPLINQAIHLGATSRYNDVQVLEAQRELAARVGMPAVLGMIPPATTLGQSLDLDLPSAVRQIEGAIFGFKKDISSTEAATDAARQTADLQVKAAKISGMTPEDILEVYKYGATPARLSGVSEETLLAFGAISKKANIGGDEAGVAFRALMAAAQSPTRGAKEALLASGLDFKNYQRNPDHIELDPFVRNVAAQYGIALNEEARNGLAKVFNDKSLIADPAKFTPAVMGVLNEALGGDDAKSKRSIAGMANRFRSASMQGVDVNAFIDDLMAKVGGNLQLANAIFGSKQGGRIATAIGDRETFTHMLDELYNHSQGYAQQVSEQRMAGFNGAVERLTGSFMNLETAIGRALDDDGKGGFLTNATNILGQTVQHIAELDPKILAIGSVLGIAASKVAEFTAAWGLANTLLEFKASTALTTSAAELSGAAAALTRAAGVQAGEAALGPGGVPGAGPGGKRGALNMVGSIIPQVAAYELGKWGIDSLFSVLPKPSKQLPADYDVSTLGLAKRLWSDAAGLFPSEPAPDLDAHSIRRQVDPGALERARRAADEYRADPEASRGRAMMDVHSLDSAAAKAKETGDAIDGLNMTVKPTVDVTDLDATEAQVNRIVRAIKSISGEISSLGPSIDRRLRGVYADIGIGHR